MRKLILLFTVLFLAGCGSRQMSPLPKEKAHHVRLDVSVKDYKTGKPLEGVNVTLVEFQKDGEAKAEWKTNAKGKCDTIVLDIELQYRLLLSKKGYIDRLVDFEDMQVDDKFNYEKGYDVPIEMPMLKKSDCTQCDAAEIKSMNETVTSVIRFQVNEETLNWDMEPITRMRERMKACAGDRAQ